MSKSETPRTDEIHSEKDKEFRDNLTQYRFMHDHAETLEKELTAVTEQRDRLAEAVITHRAKAFPLNGEDYDLELWETITDTKGGSHE